ncbi:probable cytochrome P450 28c1 isoform X2 [Stomoxys calcitrans]|uniref:Cytochrome P450 n=1 Tax=Stomoxys calcitrans TaxID=35570 RepID=A0A1I8NUE9_STOCA|nr:probable cytochrome P450 28c1 isoform X2 [Stomoxys calcitrans]
MMYLYLLAIVLTSCCITYKFLCWNFDYWQCRNVRGPKPRALFGSYPNLLLRRQHFGDDMKDIYVRFQSTDKFVGTYLMRTPTLMIIDPHIVHNIFVTSFNHFNDNDVGKLIDCRKDPLIANNPFILVGEKWRLQRSLISPALTSFRLRQCYHAMPKICDQMNDFIVNKGLLNINGKDLALRFTAESLSDCVLGMESKSFTQTPLPISENVNKFASDNIAFSIFTLISGLLPILLKYYKAKFFPSDCENFFMDLMSNAYNMRYAKATEKNDILDHLIKIKELYKLTDMEIYSHTMTFLIDGLDTTATVISHCLLMLAKEPLTQRALYEEICLNYDDQHGITFDKLNEMPYLDACIHETLRIYPPGLWSTKCCTKTYQMSNKDGKILTLNEGEPVIIPIYAFHHDAQYYPEPEIFKPERFLPENGGVKHFRDCGVFLGFGDGPRTCIGKRFALLQSKSAVAYLVRTFQVKLNKRTKPDFRLDPKSFLALHNGGVWLDFQRRS